MLGPLPRYLHEACDKGVSEVAGNMQLPSACWKGNFSGRSGAERHLKTGRNQHWRYGELTRNQWLENRGYTTAARVQFYGSLEW